MGQMRILIRFFAAAALVFMLLPGIPVWAGSNGNNECPVGLLSGMSFDDEFGAGTSDITRCLERRHNIKVVVQINQLYNTGTTKPYALGNITNLLNDYEVTHGLKIGHDYEVVVVVHGSGGPMALNNNAATPNTNSNPFQSQIEELIAKGVAIYVCMNTARTLGAKTDQLIPGVQYVPSGVSAIVDFQNLGYVYLQP
jgi:intracellular sulfur oxidation DsrE/DsrF family protein